MHWFQDAQKWKNFLCLCLLSNIAHIVLFLIFFPLYAIFLETCKKYSIITLIILICKTNFTALETAGFKTHKWLQFPLVSIDYQGRKHEEVNSFLNKIYHMFISCICYRKYPKSVYTSAKLEILSLLGVCLGWAALGILVLPRTN
jgi:hypothetical protein